MGKVSDEGMVYAWDDVIERLVWGMLRRVWDLSSRKDTVC